MVEVLLKQYTRFNDIYSKHKEGTPISVVEYILYSTGNIIRLLITLRNNELE